MKTKVKASLGVQIRSVDKDSRVVQFTASDETVDRYGTVITVKGWDLANYRKNPVFLFGHDYRSPWSVMGRTVDVKKNVEEGRLEMDVMFMPEEMSAVADFVFKLYSSKPPFLNSVSVGFLPIKWEEVKDEDQEGLKQSGSKRKAWLRYLQQELLELSAVTVPANPGANKKDVAGVMRSIIGTTRDFDAVALMAAQTVLNDEDEYEALTDKIGNWTEKNGLIVPCEGDCCSKIVCIEDFAKQNGLKCFSFPSAAVEPSVERDADSEQDEDVVEMSKFAKAFKNLEVLQNAGAVLNRKNKKLLQQASTCVASVLDSSEMMKEDVSELKEVDAVEIRLQQVEEKQDQTLEILRDIYEHLIKGHDAEEDDDDDEPGLNDEDAPEDKESLKALDNLLTKVSPPKTEEADLEADGRLSAALAGLTSK